MSTPTQILLRILSVSGPVLFGFDPAFSQDAITTHRDAQVFLDFAGGDFGKAEILKCGTAILSGARSLRDSLGAEAPAILGRVLQRPSLQKSILVGDFRVHYDTVGENTPALLDNQGIRIEGTYDAYADSVASIANYVRSYETGTLGYLPPPTDNGAGGGDEYDIYIVKWVLDPYQVTAYGATEQDVQVGSRLWTSYLKVHNDFTFVHPARGRDNRGLPALRVTLAHEFHHAIQLGGYGLWDGHQYFYEISSTWLEDVLYTDVNDYDQYLRAHFNSPEESFTAFQATGVIQYARCIWGHYIARRFGRDAMRHAWEGIQTVPPLQAMNGALETYYGSSFREAFAEWSKWNYFTGTRDSSAFYPEGAFYPQVRQITIFLTPPSQGGSASASALGATYLSVVGRPDTLVVILVNTDYDAAIMGNVGPFSYIYYLSNDPRDETSRLTPVGIYFSYNADPTKWFTWFIVGKNVSAAPVVVGVPFPSPMITGGTSIMHIPIGSSRQVVGTLSILTSSMELVYSSQLSSTPLLSGQQAFVWNGTTNKGRVTQSGIYYFVLDLEGQRYTGKFAVVRK